MLLSEVFVEKKAEKQKEGKHEDNNTILIWMITDTKQSYSSGPAGVAAATVLDKLIETNSYWLIEDGLPSSVMLWFLTTSTFHLFRK